MSTMVSTTASGSLPGNRVKLEPVGGAAGTAKIIHPDEDISLVSLELKLQQYSFTLFRKNFVLLCRDINK